MPASPPTHSHLWYPFMCPLPPDLRMSASSCYQCQLLVIFSNLLSITELEFSPRGGMCLHLLKGMSDHQNQGDFGYNVLLRINLSQLLVDFLQSVRLLGLVECFGLWPSTLVRLRESHSEIVEFQRLHLKVTWCCQLTSVLHSLFHVLFHVWMAGRGTELKNRLRFLRGDWTPNVILQ